jgi:hypothetical protein
MGSTIQQSGLITIGHLVKWVAPGAIADAGPLGASQKVLAYQQGADFNSITDQPIGIPNTITAFQLTGIIVTNATESITTAAGGFYPALSKAGSPIVLAAQSYAALTGPNLLLQPTLTAFAQTARFSTPALLTNNQIVFSLTTPQGTPCYADIYLLGIDLTINPASF